MAAQNAIANPLLDEVSLKGAKAVLVNVTGGMDMTLLEVDEAANAISDQVDPEANIIFGAAFDPSLEGVIRVSVVATGMDGASIAQIEPKPVSRNTTTAAADR
jgi:cell division protein FtsZ